MAVAVGRAQPLSAHLTGDSPKLQRFRAEHSRAVRRGAVRLARVDPFGAEAGNEALVRRLRQLVRGGRPSWARPGGGGQPRRGGKGASPNPPPPKKKASPPLQ